MMMVKQIARDRTVDRLDPAYLSQWQAYYRKVYTLYADGSISRVDASNAFVSLGFRDSALKIELIEVDKARAKAWRVNA